MGQSTRRGDTKLQLDEHTVYRLLRVVWPIVPPKFIILWTSFLFSSDGKDDNKFAKYQRRPQSLVD